MLYEVITEVGLHVAEDGDIHRLLLSGGGLIRRLTQLYPHGIRRVNARKVGGDATRGRLVVAVLSC